MWDDEIDSVLLSSLQSAYLRRTQWEMRLQANEILRALNESLSPTKEGLSSSPQNQRVSAEKLMTTMGATWH